MKWDVLYRAFVFLPGIAATAMIVPLIPALAFGETEMILPFVLPAAAALILFFPAAFLARKRPPRFYPGDSLPLVFPGWVFICLLGAAPFYLSGFAPSLAGAVFESVSGFTTTGATVFADVETLPRSLLFWRAMTQWLGGMGAIVLAAVFLPLPEAGVLQPSLNSLFRAESPGPVADKISPRFTGTLKQFGILYAALTALQVLLLAAGGMTWFDAAVHAFSTVSTGGFSSRNAGIAAYRSPFIGWVCTTGMFLAGLNFSLVFRLLRGRCRDFCSNSEARAYGGITLAAVIIITWAILPQSPSPGTAIRQAVFQAVSVLTTTGYAAAGSNRWPPLGGGILFFLMFIGGCSGSAAGGIKVIRHVALVKQMGNEMKKIIYPRGVFSIQINGRPGGNGMVYGAAGFVFLYFVCLFAAALLVSGAGLDVFSSVWTALICLGNTGPGPVPRFPGFSAFPGYVTWGLSFVMLLGRLELWAVIVFFSGLYRRN
jgi:trk system potassium uptake protein TrkH